MVLARSAVHSALLLAAVMLCLAAFYTAENAPFLAVVQIVVYTGAVMMLFLFVLMLIGVDSTDSLIETLRGQRAAAFVVGLGFAVLLVADSRRRARRVRRTEGGHRRRGGPWQRRRRSPSCCSPATCSPSRRPAPC